MATTDAIEQPFATEAGAAIEPGAAHAHLPEGPPGRAWRWIDRLVLAGVMLGLLVPGALLVLGKHARPIENRPLLAMPEAKLDGVLDASWFKGVDAFLADNVLPRTYAIRLRGEVYLLSGGTGTPQVLRGNEGWLFSRGELDPNCRRAPDEVLAELRSAATALEAKGVTFRFVGVPDKHSIYPEKVGANPFGPSCTDEARAALRGTIADLGTQGIDGWTILEAARAADPGRQLYYKYDTHWTPDGALSVVRALITSLDPGAWDEAEVGRATKRQWRGDLARQVGVRRVERTPRTVVRRDVKIVETDVPVPVDLRNAESVFKTTVSTDLPTVEGRTLILYDSYFEIDLPLIAKFFDDATWVHVGDMQRHPELATILGPFDTVIVERVERFMYGDQVGAMLRDVRR